MNCISVRFLSSLSYYYSHIYRNKMNPKYKMCDCVYSNWSHRNSNTRFFKKIGNHIKIMLSRFIKKDGYTYNIPQNKEKLQAEFCDLSCWITVRSRGKIKKKMPVTKDKIMIMIMMIVRVVIITINIQ